MKLDRRWWLVIGVVVVVIVVVGYDMVSSMVNQPPEECGPVEEMFEFNRSQSALIESKTGESDGVPTAAQEAAYRAWADGLAERAQKVSSSRPDLVAQSSHVARLANEFVGELSTLRAQTASRAPDGPAPPALFEMAVINDQITRKLEHLADACSG